MNNVKKTIAVITPTQHLFTAWIDEIGRDKYPGDEFEFIRVSKIDHCRGRYFFDVEKGFESFGIDPRVYVAALLKIKKSGS